MKILIMVLSFDNPPYSNLMQAQFDTWDSVPEENVNTLYYHGGNPRSMHHKIIRQHHKSVSHVLQVPATDAYYLMADKFRMAMDYVWHWDWDIIFRTNSSSYVNKKQLVKFAANLPKEKLYAGWTMKDTNHDGGMCVSGAGIFLSRDCVEILTEEIDPTKEIEEDVEIGRLLRKEGIVAIHDERRFDYPQGFLNGRYFWETYHIRFKTNDRMQDVENMRTVHQKIIS